MVLQFCLLISQLEVSGCAGVDQKAKGDRAQDKGPFMWMDLVEHSSQGTFGF